jgi:hypothetical protein
MTHTTRIAADSVTRALMLALVVLFAHAASSPTSAADSVERRADINITPAAQPDAAIEVTGLDAKTLTQFKNITDDETWRGVLAVHVGADRDADQPALLGRYTLTADRLRFQPRFGLRRGLTYRVSFHAPDAEPLTRTFTIPDAPRAEATRIAAVYPSSSQLPENLLRLYLHFSAPMSRGDSYGYIRIEDASGKAVAFPFLELPQELWNDEATRLTILFDPGRVKEGLRPREEDGPVLVAGRRYTLVIDGRWQDATGRPLGETFRKPFLAAPADKTQPDPRQWKITPPAAGTRDPLTIGFNEPLDHGMLQRVIRIMQPDGNEMDGDIEVTRLETLWRFTPRQPWRAGTHALSIATVLEDRAGNSIGRAFEVDLNKTEGRQPIERVLRFEFEVRAPSK